MFGRQDRLYFETDGSGEMLKFLKSFRPILRLKAKGDLKCGDETIGEIYKVSCGKTVAKAIERYFEFRERKDTTMTITENGTTRESDVTLTLGKR